MLPLGSIIKWDFIHFQYYAGDTQLYPSQCFILQDKGSITVTANIDYKFVKLTNKLIVESKPTLETTEVFIDRGEEMPLV